MAEQAITEDPGEAKANMDAIYIQPDPRAYFRELGKVDYIIPDLAKPVFQALAGALRARRDGPLQALDLGCSYGVNAALLKHDLSMAELHDHWTDDSLTHASAAQVVAEDRRYFAQRDHASDITVVGLDQSEPAIAYGEESGLLDAGLAIDLENNPLPPGLSDQIAATDLMMSTGAVGYLTERTFDRLLAAMTRDEKPWIANFVLRMFPFDAIEATLADRGYVTEKLGGRSFVQRDFVSRGERDRVLSELEALGIDPRGKEAEGQLHAEFFLSRPANEAEVPLPALLAA